MYIYKIQQPLHHALCMFVVCEYNTGDLVSFTVVVYSHVHENTCMTAIIILRGEVRVYITSLTPPY